MGNGTTFILRLPTRAEAFSANNGDRTISPVKEKERLHLQRLELLRRIEALGKRMTLDEADTVRLEDLGQLVTRRPHLFHSQRDRVRQWVTLS